MATSLSPGFIKLSDTADSLAQLRKKSVEIAEKVSVLTAAPFNVSFDYLRRRAARHSERGDAASVILETEQMIEYLNEINDESLTHTDLQAALLSILTALHIETNRLDEAIVDGAAALNILSRTPRRKDEPFLVILASLLFDLAQIHAGRAELKQAEREIEKSVRILERIAAKNPERYGPAHLMAIDASTNIYSSRIKQASMLAHSQVATTTYMEMLNAGGDDTAMRAATAGLIDSLVEQGTTLMQMGRQRESIGFFTRALKMLTRLEPEFDLRQLELSISLGEALLAAPSTRDKGVHLLNTMLHKASKLHSDELHRRIVDILMNVKTNRLNILSIWHKVFPK